MSIDPAVEVLDEGPDDVETVVTTWLGPLLPRGQVANARLTEDPLPFVVVNHISGEESLELSNVDELVSVHCLYRKGLGQENRSKAAKFAADVHRRMLLLGRYLEPVVINGRPADIDYCDVAMRPRWEPYGDEQILRKIARYRLGLSYTRVSS